MHRVRHLVMVGKIWCIERRGIHLGARAAWYLLVALCLFAAAMTAHAQDNYEIQVYGAETVPPGETLIELHSNFTLSGSKTIDEFGVLPTNHALHETLEVTHGFTSWFEVGFYLFTSARRGDGWHYVGSHIRPRVRAPARWKLPVGLSVSAEAGFQKREYASDQWTLEIRPIIDKQIKRWYLAFNPTLDRSFKGANAKRGFAFSPNAKVGYDLTKKITAGVEYYGALGPLMNFDPFRDQQQQFFGVIDLNVSPKWEFNFGVGVGATAGTDHLIVKAIVGRRVTFRRKNVSP
jgi:hypothetical protein